MQISMVVCNYDENKMRRILIDENFLRRKFPDLRQSKLLSVMLQVVVILNGFDRSSAVPWPVNITVA